MTSPGAPSSSTPATGATSTWSTGPATVRAMAVATPGEVLRVDETELNELARAHAKGGEEGPDLVRGKPDVSGEKSGMERHLRLLLRRHDQLVPVAGHIRLSANSLFDVLVVLLVSKGHAWILHSGRKELPRCQSLADEAAGTHLEQRKRFDELVRGHVRHSVVLAEVVGGHLVDLVRVAVNIRAVWNLLRDGD